MDMYPGARQQESACTVTPAQFTTVFLAIFIEEWMMNRALGEGAKHYFRRFVRISRFEIC